LSTALWRPTSSRTDSADPSPSNKPAAWSPPVRSNTRCASRSRSGSETSTSAATVNPGGTTSQRTAMSSSDALPQTPHDEVA